MKNEIEQKTIIESDNPTFVKNRELILLELDKFFDIIFGEPEKKGENNNEKPN